MKKIILLVILSHSVVFSQDKHKCNNLLNKEFNITKINKNPLVFKKNIESTFYCSGLSDDDIYTIRNTSFFQIILMEFASKNTSKFRDLSNKFKEVVTTKNFQEIKNKIIPLKNLETKKVNINNWDEDKKIFEKIGVPKEAIKKIYSLVKSNKKDITYKELLKPNTRNKTSYIHQKHSQNNNIVRDYFVKVEDFDFNQIKKEAERTKKPLLLFFTGYACVNALKMEENVLGDNEVIELLKKYYCVALYVDEHKELPENKWTKSKRKERYLKNLGQKVSEFQTLEFKCNFQPFFAIIRKGSTEKTIGYSDLEDFLNFIR